MSVSRTSQYTPRSSASHGRIVTQNSSLSAALLREKSQGIVAADSRTASVEPSSALDVVSSTKPKLDVVSNPTADHSTNVQYIAVSKPRPSLSHASNTDLKLADSEHSPCDPAVETDTVAETLSADQDENEPAQPIRASQVTDSIEHHRYSYHSLKKSGRASSNSTHESLLGSKTVTKSSLIGDSGEVNKGIDGHSDPSVLALTSDSNKKSAVRYGDGVDANVNSNARVNSKSSLFTAQGQENIALGSKATSTHSRNNSTAHEARPEHQHRLDAHQHTRLSLHSSHDRIFRDREPLQVDAAEKSVPPLDLSAFSNDNKPPSDCSDSDSDIPVSSQPQLQAPYSDQNLHASDPNNSHLYFSSHECNQTGRKTYEVATPVNVSQLPHVNSSANFSGDWDTYREERGGNPEPLHQQQGAEQSRSDLADGLELPEQFDSQANRGQGTPGPPSPPTQTTPPPQAEPATSLHSKSNSSVYAVANPEVQRAQGISPPPGAPYIHSQSRRSDHNEVRFDSASRDPRPQSESRSPIKDRPPTPYARTPSVAEGPSGPGSGSAGQRRGSVRTLPPQHPPLDTQRRDSTKQGSASRKNSGTTVKRVYVESPSFTRQEEDEYRFVDSRLEDTIEDKTFREPDMEARQRGYGGDDMGYSQGHQQGDGRSQYSSKQAQPVDNRPRQEQGGYQERGHDQDRRSRDRYEDDTRDRHEDRNRDRYEDKSPNKHDDRNRDRYEDRNNEMDGYGSRDKLRQKDEGRYEDRDRGERYGREEPAYDPRERYDRLHNEREVYDRELHRDPEPDFNRYQKQNTEVRDEQDLRKESEYQQDLKNRIDRQKDRDRDREEFVGQTLQHRDSYDRENFARDSLDYPEGGDTARGDPRDSLEYGNYAQQNTAWGNPPQNPYQENAYSQYPQQGMDQRQSSKPDFYDQEDVERMELVNPKQPKYDYVEHNKEDYGMVPRKTYRDLVHKKREEEEKLNQVFITPKVPPKHGKHGKGKKAKSAQPEHMGYQPPVVDQYPLGFKPSSAEELWAQKAKNLSNKKDSAGSSKHKTSAGKPPRWSSSNKVEQPYSYKPPQAMPNQGSAYKPVGQPVSRDTNQGYSPIPARALQPLDNRPAPPTSTQMVPTAIQPESPFRRHGELKPITQEILTEDGQRIHVDINLRLISPPPGQSGPGSPTSQQLALVPVQETQGQYGAPDDRVKPIGVPYQMQDTYGRYDAGAGGSYNAGYHEQDITQTVPISDIEQQINAEEMALGGEQSGYSRKYNPGGQGGGSPRPRDDTGTADSKDDGSYAALYQRNRSKDPDADPWYKVYNLNDYKKMQREVRLNRGTLGPDMDTEDYKDKLEKRHRQFEYARNVMEKNRVELGTKKPPPFPRQPAKQGEENIKRRAAIEYSKNIPKPTVKPRPNQYNSYEVSAQLSQRGGGAMKSPSSSKATPPPQTMDVIDIRTLEQRHLAERKNTDKIRQNMDSVLSQKAH